MFSCCGWGGDAWGGSTGLVQGRHKGTLPKREHLGHYTHIPAAEEGLRKPPWQVELSQSGEYAGKPPELKSHMDMFPSLHPLPIPSQARNRDSFNSITTLALLAWLVPFLCPPLARCPELSSPAKCRAGCCEVLRGHG